MEKYDLRTLRKENGSYDMEHTVTYEDVDKANRYIELIESTRENFPKVGDIVELTTKHGDYYRNAHIEESDVELNICEQPYVPFIKPDKSGISCNTSGGSWLNIPVNLKLIGKRYKTFCDWGHCGACGNGAIDFKAEVNVWEYIEPEPLYGDFTTKNWRRMYVSKVDKEKSYRGYEYIGDGFAWRDKAEFDAFIKKYKGAVFAGNYLNQMVVWCYFDKKILVSKEELEKMNLPETTILLNGIRPAKMEVDDKNKIIIHYANW